MEKKNCEVCILGAGPGGVATALKLDSLGIPCVLLDKAVFPRDKICGDAVSGKVSYVFNRIDKRIMVKFRQSKAIKVNCWGVKFVFPRDREAVITMPTNLDLANLENTKSHGFVSKRLEFDNFLIDWVKNESNVELREGVEITEYEKLESGGFILRDKKKTVEITTKILIAADGAHSRFARKFGNIHKEDKHYAGAIRAYYKNVGGVSPYNFIELHYVKEFMPGYLWIFPLPNGDANVGVGMRTDLLSKKKVKLKEEMLNILNTHPRFKDRFENAELDGKIRGFGLPLGSKKRKISGDHYILVGDAASLIDPLTGEGIGNAAISGLYAAEQAAKCLEEQNFSAAFMKSYDKGVYKYLGNELQISYQLQRFLQYPRLTTFLSDIAFRNKQFLTILASMFTDVNLRKKIRDPRFYLKMLFNRS